MKTSFEKIVGKENVTEDIADKEVYGTDASRIKGSARIIVWVENKEQIHHIVLFAKRNKINLVARGGGTNLVGSSVPDNSAILDFSKMNKVLEIGKNYAIVQPGIIIDELNTKLKDKMFPIIPLSSDIATIGGLVAMNGGSPRSFKYGRTNDWVISAEVIDGTGRNRELRSEDICGSEGTLGLITEIKIRTTNKITNVSYEVFSFDELEPLVEKAATLKNRTDILSLDFINSIASEMCLIGSKNYLLVEYEGKGGSIVKEEIKNILEKRYNIKALLYNAGYKIVQDPIIPFNNLIEFLYWLRLNKVPCFGHIGTGVLHPVFRDMEKIKQMNIIVERFGGKINGELGIGLLNKEFVKEDFKTKYMKLKQLYDPENALNKGKIV